MGYNTECGGGFGDNPDVMNKIDVSGDWMSINGMVKSKEPLSMSNIQNLVSAYVYFEGLVVGVELDLEDQDKDKKFRNLSKALKVIEEKLLENISSEQLEELKKEEIRSYEDVGDREI